MDTVMLDLTPNALFGIIAGSLLFLILATAGWFARRAVLRIDKEIDKMEVAQREFEKLLLNVSIAQVKFDFRLESGFDRIGTDMGNVRNSITGLSSNTNRMSTDLYRMKTITNGSQSSTAGLISAVRDHQAAIDKEIAVIRERISRNGSQ